VAEGGNLDEIGSGKANEAKREVTERLEEGEDETVKEGKACVSLVKRKVSAVWPVFYY